MWVSLRLFTYKIWSIFHVLKAIILYRHYWIFLSLSLFLFLPFTAHLSNGVQMKICVSRLNGEYSDVRFCSFYQVDRVHWRWNEDHLQISSIVLLSKVILLEIKISLERWERLIWTESKSSNEFISCCNNARRLIEKWLRFCHCTATKYIIEYSSSISGSPSCFPLNHINIK